LEEVKVIVAHLDNIQTFEAISKHLEMEEDYMKAYAPPNGVGPGTIGLTVARSPRRVLTFLRTLKLKVVLVKSIRLRAQEIWI